MICWLWLLKGSKITLKMWFDHNQPGCRVRCLTLLQCSLFSTKQGLQQSGSTQSRHATELNKGSSLLSLQTLLSIPSICNRGQALISLLKPLNLHLTSKRASSSLLIGANSPRQIITRQLNCNLHPSQAALLTSVALPHYAGFLLSLPDAVVRQSSRLTCL